MSEYDKTKPEIKFDYPLFLDEQGGSVYEQLPDNKLKLLRYDVGNEGYHVGENVKLHYRAAQSSDYQDLAGRISSVRRLDRNPTTDPTMDNEQWYELILDLYD